MKSLRKPFPWACLSTSFAMALDMSHEDFARLAGHDGGEIVFPDLPEPQCRRGFHISEAVYVAMWKGYSATPLEVIPLIAPSSGSDPPIPVLYGQPQHRDVESNWNRFNGIIAIRRGVIECRTRKGNWHAVAFSTGLVYDPDTGGAPFPYSREACEARGLYPVRLWRIEKLPT